MEKIYSPILGAVITYQKPLIFYVGGLDVKLYKMFAIFSNTWGYRQYIIEGKLDEKIQLPVIDWRENIGKKELKVRDWNASKSVIETISQFYTLFKKKPLLKSFSDIETELQKLGYKLTKYEKIYDKVEFFEAIFKKS